MNSRSEAPSWAILEGLRPPGGSRRKAWRSGGLAGEYTSKHLELPINTVGSVPFMNRVLSSMLSMPVLVGRTLLIVALLVKTPIV